ncbi:MAG: hypothetical protein ACLPIX_16040, partial [Rhodomicrobium sp.]
KTNAAAGARYDGDTALLGWHGVGLCHGMVSGLLPSRVMFDRKGPLTPALSREGRGGAVARSADGF